MSVRQPTKHWNKVFLKGGFNARPGPEFNFNRLSTVSLAKEKCVELAKERCSLEREGRFPVCVCLQNKRREEVLKPKRKRNITKPNKPQRKKKQNQVK